MVAEVGAGVTAFREGDRVVALNSAPCDVCFFCRHGQQNLCEDLLFNNGAYAEFIRIPARIVEKNTLLVPDRVPLEHAALTEPLACVVRGLEESGARAGDTMVVIGAGPIGLMFMHVAELAGVKVIAVVKREDQIAAAKLFGAEQVVQVGAAEDVVAATRALTPEGRGADVVIEAVASPNLGVGGRYGAQGRRGELLRRAAEWDEGAAGYESSALRRHHAEGELSSHPGDVPDGV